MKTLFTLVIVIIFLISCEKNNQLDLDYDCFKKTTNYNSVDKVLSWNIFYYNNDNNIRQEYSNGDIWLNEFDNFGNIISVSFYDSRTEYEYNIANKVINTKYYTNNQLDYYSIAIYKDTILDKAYSINKNNDTISWSFYYYNSENRIDSINSDNNDTYYYYSLEIDSIVTLNKENGIISRRFFKYSNEKKIYEESRLYDVSEQVVSYFIKTWEYNVKGLLIRQTEDHLYASGEKQWIDERKYYDSIGKISRSEAYDEGNYLVGYSLYYYENTNLTRIESFDNNDHLKSYSLIENSCIK